MSITKNEITELNSLVMPPSGCVLVQNAMCVIFAKKPDPANYKRLAPKLLDSVRDYDYKATSEYVSKTLKAYYDNPAFEPDLIAKQNRMCSILCEWARNVYEYTLLKSDWDGMQTSGGGRLLRTLLAKHVFGVFAWPLFAIRSGARLADWQQQQRRWSQLDASIASRLAATGNRHIMTVNEYYDTLMQIKPVDEFVREHDCFALPEQHAKAESARVNYMHKSNTCNIPLLNMLLKTTREISTSMRRADSCSQILNGSPTSFKSCQNRQRPMATVTTFRLISSHMQFGNWHLLMNKKSNI